MRGIGERVAERDLHAVRGAVEGDLVDAELRAQGLDVLDRVAARVVEAARAEPPGAGTRRAPRVEQVGALQRAAAQQPGPAGAALVEDDQVAAAEGRREHPQPVALEGLGGGLAGSAGEHEQRPAAGAPLRLDPLHEQRDAAGRRPAAIERHAHARALEQERPAALEVERRAGRGRGQQGDRGGGDQGGGESHVSAGAVAWRGGAARAPARRGPPPGPRPTPAAAAPRTRLRTGLPPSTPVMVLRPIRRSPSGVRGPDSRRVDSSRRRAEPVDRPAHEHARQVLDPPHAQERAAAAQIDPPAPAAQPASVQLEVRAREQRRQRLEGHVEHRQLHRVDRPPARARARPGRPAAPLSASGAGGSA